MKEKSSFDSKLFGQALIKFFAGLLIVSALVFVPAGRLRYPQGLLFPKISASRAVFMEMTPIRRITSGLLLASC